MEVHKVASGRPYLAVCGKRLWTYKGNRHKDDEWLCWRGLKITRSWGRATCPVCLGRKGKREAMTFRVGLRKIEQLSRHLYELGCSNIEIRFHYGKLWVKVNSPNYPGEQEIVTSSLSEIEKWMRDHIEELVPIRQGLAERAARIKKQAKDKCEMLRRRYEREERNRPAQEVWSK